MFRLSDFLIYCLLPHTAGSQQSASMSNAMRLGFQWSIRRPLGITADSQSLWRFVRYSAAPTLSAKSKIVMQVLGAAHMLYLHGRSGEAPEI